MTLEKADKSGTVSVALVGDEQIRELNRRFLDRDRPTDVLAFPLGTGEPGAWGEVVVSVDTARRQAAERNGGLQEELLLLAVHGTLHLLGQDDDTPAGWQQMMEDAREIVAACLRERGAGSPG
ncbi:MAG: rRNA maturation RNase YbeY [Bacillota bacterium]